MNNLLFTTLLICFSFGLQAQSAPPEARCLENVTADLGPDGNIVLTPEDLNDGSSDDNTTTSDLILALDFGGTVLNCDDIGAAAQSVKLIVTDGDGFSSSCITQVTVEDNIAPEAKCRASVNVPVSQDGTVNVNLASLDNGSTNGDGSTDGLSFSVDLGGEVLDCADVGVITVGGPLPILIVTDSNGQSDSYTTRIQVVDNTTPVLVCQDVVMELDPITGINNLDTLFAAAIISATDNCAPLDTFIQNLDILNPPAPILTCNDIGTTSCRLGVKSSSTNFAPFAFCNVTITVTDPSFFCNDAPVARCLESLTVELDEDGNSNLNNGSTDLETPADELVFSFDPAEGPLDCDDVSTSAVSLIVTNKVGKVGHLFYSGDRGGQRCAESHLPEHRL